MNKAPGCPKRFAFGDIIVVMLLFAGAFISWKHMNQPQGESVLITVDGRPYGKWPLPALPETISVRDQMKVELEPQGVRVLSSTCPRQLCVHQGFIHKSGQNIVCVPNRIVIQLLGEESSVDAIAQ